MAVQASGELKLRTIQRDIVGGFIVSKDGKVLLGLNRKGGHYEGSYVVPGGGIEEGETKEEALRREMREETGIDVTKGTVTEVNTSTGANEKTLRDTSERVFVEMTFYDFMVALPWNAADISVIAEDDWTGPVWFTPQELTGISIAPPTSRTLRKIGFISD